MCEIKLQFLVQILLSSCSASESYVFECPNKCGRRYKHKNNLYTHVTFECGKAKQFKCSLCQQAYSRKGTLKVHLITVHKLII